MDIKDLRGLMEAYLQVNASSHQVDEAYKEFPREKIRAKADALKAKADKNEPISHMSDSEISDLRAKKDKMRSRASAMGAASNVGTYSHSSNLASKRNKERPEDKKRSRTVEELDIFDVVLEFLQVEGYAETLEEAEWMMANLLDKEEIDIIVEASCEDDEEDEKEMKKGKKSKKEEEGEDEEEEEELDEALTGERYKKVMKKPGGTAYSRKVSADPAKRATRGGRGGESDFGAGDRGAGNKAARRAGTYQEEYVDEASSRDEFTRAAIARSSGRKGGITFEPGPNWDPSANRGKGAHLSPKQKEKQRRKALRQEEYVDEATYSAKAARAGKDIGKPGKAFAKIAKSAAKRYGSKERGEKVAGAILAKLRAKRG